MATRSAIGYALPSGKVKAVYCHWDGSPSTQLPILTKHYNSLPKVRALIRPGSMSSLHTEQLWESTYDTKTFTFTPSRPAQPLYHHERGQGPWCAHDGSYGQPPQTVSETEVEAFWLAHGCEHLYIFRSGYGWFHYELL